MKRNVSLYIAGTKVDLDDNSLILFNYAMTDLTNPTIVKNSYSHQVKLKGTKTNNKLFGEIFRLDRQTIYSDGYTGVNFDPMRKTPFEIYDETSTCLESGYVKLNSISRNGADISYNVTLYGGLGSFLYGLSYNEDGSKKTLADLIYRDMDGNDADFVLPNVSVSGSGMVSEALGYLGGNVGVVEYKKIWNIVNFALCYNGLPKEFDTDKVLLINGKFNNNIDKSSVSNPDDFGVKSNAQGYVRALLTRPHNEIEMNDYRWYLQRPVISLREIILAICDGRNNGGYSVVLDESFFNENNPYYNRLWVTLTMISASDRTNEMCLVNILKATKSPADYLISFLKTCGLVIVCNEQNKEVSIKRRDTFFQDGFNDGIIDLSNRIELSSCVIDATLSKSRGYKMGSNVDGEFAQEYKAEYNVEYGVQRLDTGYEFNNSTSAITDGVVFNAAAEVLEKSRLFLTYQERGQYKTFLPPKYEQVEVELWNNKDDKSKKFPLEASFDINSTITNFLNKDYPLYDRFSKLQLHGREQEPHDGENVLVFFTGTFGDGNVSISYDPTSIFEVLNEGRPCWIWGQALAGASTPYYLPKFQRFIRDAEGKVTHSLEWGVPLAIGIPDIQIEDKSLYHFFWQNFLRDRYDDSTRVLRCKVNLRGYKADTLLRRFFWYEGAYWVLSKISNYSVSTYDMAECEFVKVQSIENYTSGQIEI